MESYNEYPSVKDNGMVNALHIYGCGYKKNSGDLLLGPSTKHFFENMISQKLNWESWDVTRNIKDKHIDYFNTFDYIVIGGGGLLLPDTNSNNVSCWQWPIDSNLLAEIKTPIYVISIGLNWFFGQDASMPYYDSLRRDQDRIPIFKNNIETLVNKSEYFSMRHKGDINQINSFMEFENKNKIKFEFCPVIEYVEDKYKRDDHSGQLYTFELKDDRIQRRYENTSIEKVYETLFNFILYLEKNNKKIGIMSHDGSKSFKEYVDSKGFKNYTYLDNSVGNEKRIIDNYRQVKKLYCSAGHSQMMSHALGIDYYTLISHPKLKYFMDDVGYTIPKHGSFVKDLTLEILIENL